MRALVFNCMYVQKTNFRNDFRQKKQADNQRNIEIR